jgi:hypothetical protein
MSEQRLYRGEPFPAGASPISQNRPSALARIAAEKAVLPFPAPFRGLVLSFHKSDKIAIGQAFVQKPQGLRHRSAGE